MMPELLLQRADNKTKIKNSHPQTSQTPHTSNCKRTRRPGKSCQRDTGTGHHTAVGITPRTQARGSGLVCPHWHSQSRETYFSATFIFFRANTTLLKKRNRQTQRQETPPDSFSCDGVFLQEARRLGELHKSETERNRLWIQKGLRGHAE